MNSTMTEKQFRQELIESGMVPVCEYKPLIERFVEITKRAGLEFAPEPVRLPDLIATAVLEDRRGQPVVVIDARGVREWLSQREVDEVCARAMAYPGLREAAKKLVGLIRSNLAPQTQHYIEDETAHLEAELAKGPK